MPGPEPASTIELTTRQQRILRRMLRRHKLAYCLVWRIQIILLASRGYSNSEIARRVGKDRNTVRLWRTRWVQASATLEEA